MEQIRQPHPPTIGRYQIAGVLATGGMAELFLGKLLGPSGFERPVVIKRILPHLARDEQFRAMFLDEARIAAGVRSPNVVQVSELGQDGDDLFIVMEYLSGETAVGLMRMLSLTARPLSPALATHIVAEAANGLQAAHELVDADGALVGLVHRDISPDNLFITYDGGVKLLDFGIAHAKGRLTRTETGSLKGKFSYMSPEQCRGEPLDGRSDVFSLGVVLWELSVGKRLYSRKNHLLTMHAIVHEPSPAPADFRDDYPPALDEICRRALAKDPAHRYESARQMRLALVAALRRLSPDVDLADELRTLMRATFAERLDEKSAMLRAVRDGVPLTSLPAQEPAGPDVHTESDAPAFSPPARSRARLFAYALPALALAAGLGVLLVSRRAPPAPVVIAPVLPPPAAPAPAPAPVLERSVSVAIDSRPSRASIFVDGVERGATPSTLQLPRGDQAHAVELRHAGFRPRLAEITPDADQKLELVLEPVPRPTKHAAPPRYHRFE